MRSALLSLCLLAVLSGLQAQLLPIFEGTQRGLMSPGAAVVLAPAFDDLYLSPDSAYYYLKKGRKTGLFRPGTGILIPPVYDQIMCQEQGFLLAQAGHWGLADSNGQEVIPPAFIQIQWLVADVFVCRKGKLVGARSLYHGLQLEPIYVGIETLHYQGEIRILAARQDGQTDVFSLNGHLLAENIPYQLVQALPNGGFIFQENELFGLMDSTLNLLLEPHFRQWKLQKGLVLFRDTLHWGLFAPDGTERLPVVYDSLLPEKQLWWTYRDQAWGWADARGQLRADTSLLTRPTFGGNVAKIRYHADGLYGLLNQYGDLVTTNRYKALDIYPAEGVALALKPDDSKSQIPFDADGRPLDRRILLVTADRPGTGKGPSRISAPQSHPDSLRLARLGWRQLIVEGEKQWGMIDTLSGAWLIRPQYDRIRLSPEGRYGIAIRWQTLGGQLGLRETYHIVDHVSRKFLEGPTFIAAYPDDLKDSPTMRVMTSNLAFGLVHLDSSMRYQPFGRACFIGPMRGGLARIFFSSDATRFRILPEQSRDAAWVDAHFAKDKKPRWLYVKADGKYLIDTMQYEYAGDFVNGIARVRRAGLFGLLNTQGEEVLPPRYSYLADPGAQFPYLITRAPDSRLLILDPQGQISGEMQPYHDPNGNLVQAQASLAFQEGLAPVSANRRWSIANLEGQILAPFAWEEILPYQEGLAAAKGAKGWGYLDPEARWAIEPSFRSAGGFQEGLAPVRGRQGWGYIRPNGKWAIKAKYRETGPFVDGTAIVKKDRYGVMDVNGKWIIKPLFVSIERLPDAYRVRRRGTYALFDRQGKVLVPPIYSWIGYWGEGILPFIQNSYYGFLDTTLQVLIPPKYTKAGTFSHGLAPVRTNQWGYINRQDEMVIEPQYVVAEPFSKGVARVALAGEKRGQYRWGLIDTAGRYLFEPIYQKIQISPEGYYFLQKGDTCSYLDPYGIPLRMEPIRKGTPFENGFAVIERGGGKALLDLDGNLVFPQQAHQLVPPKEAHWVVEQQNRYGLIDRQGKEILPPEYYQIEAVPGTDILQLIQGEAYLYLRADGRWLTGVDK